MIELEGNVVPPFLFPNYAAPLEAVSSYITAAFPKGNYGAKFIICTKGKQIPCLNLINLKRGLTTARDENLFWTH